MRPFNAFFVSQRFPESAEARRTPKVCLMSHKIVFFLNGEKIEITVEDSPGLRPDTTLLNWLRHAQKLTGTKEGCAEGDCGACSVVIGRLAADNTPHWHAVNACILFLPMLHGSVVTTIEGVASADGSLHPVQHSMIEHHGAQCGFCTPGFVMSLYAGWCSGSDFTTAEIEILLSGNLCRCTGYGPIVRAGRALSEAVRPQWAVDRLQRDLSNLRDMQAKENHQTLELQADGQRYSAPSTTKALQILYAENPDAHILSGATDIGLWVTKQHRQLPHLIHIGGIAELNQIEKSDTHITIGAGVTHQQAMQYLAEDYPALQEIWARFGSAQVRASGRVCGNIANASPIGDLAPCFLALDGEILLNRAGQHRRLKLSEFFIDYGQQNRQPGEFVEAVILPRLQADQQLFAYKLSKRFDQDISAVLMAVCLHVRENVITDIRIGFGGMAAIPRRAPHLEALLAGKKLVALECLQAAEQNALRQDIARCLEADFDPIDDMRASRAYRLLAAGQLIEKLFIEYSDGKIRLSEPQRFRTPGDFTLLARPQ